MKEKYRIIFYFDYGCCLWDGNDKTRERFGFGCIAAVLPLPPETVDRMNELIAWHRTWLNWSDPLAPGQWRQEECDRFNAAATQLFEAIKGELGDAFEVVNQQGEFREDPDLDEYLEGPEAYWRERRRAGR